MRRSIIFTRKINFLVVFIAFGFAVTAIFHFALFLYPDPKLAGTPVQEFAYAVINILAMIVVLSGPRKYFLFFIPFFVQQLVSRASFAFDLYLYENYVDYVSIVIFSFAPFVIFYFYKAFKNL